jgi:hypothetical protein
VILDPELAGTASPATPAVIAVTTGASDKNTRPSANAAEARVVLHTRAATKTQRNDPGQDIYQSTTLATFDATVRRSESLRFVVGLRARYHFASMAANTADAVASHAELDVLPTAGYVDSKLADGLHLQLGYQPVHLGRFDIFSATDVLAVHDLRDGAATMAEAAEVAQISALADYDVSSWLSFRAIYVPFFTAHVISVVQSDYALVRATQAGTDAAFRNSGDQGARLQGLLLHNLTRGDRDSIAQTGLAALGPDPTFAQPQGALRATAHSASGEVALTAATALEHLPALRASQTLKDYVRDPSSLDAQARLAADNRPLVPEYNRFAVLSADAVTDIGPVSVGLEGAYMVHRTLMAETQVAATTGSGSMPGIATPASTDVLQVGARAEYIRGTEWLVAAEAFFAYTLSPAGPGPHHYLLMEDGRFARGVGALVSYAPDAFPIHLELGAGLLSGPSLVVSPRVAYSILDNFDVELGALFVEGAAPAIGSSTISLGHVYDNVDQVFVGLRYLP